MIGWFVVLAATGALVAVARWYLKGEGVTGYRVGDRDEITRVRIATMNVG